MDKDLLPLLCGLAMLSGAAMMTASQRQAPGIADSIQGALRATRPLASQISGARPMRMDQALRPADDAAVPAIGDLPVFELSRDALPCAGSDSLKVAGAARVCAWAI